MYMNNIGFVDPDMTFFLFFREILEKLGISDKVSVMMARKKWNYLVKRYQVRKCVREFK